MSNTNSKDRDVEDMLKFYNYMKNVQQTSKTKQFESEQSAKEVVLTNDSKIKK